MTWWALEVEEDDFPEGVPGVVLWNPAQTVYRLENGRFVIHVETIMSGYVLVGSVHGWEYVEHALDIKLLRLGGITPSELLVKEVELLKHSESEITWNAESHDIGCQIVVSANGSEYDGHTGEFLGVVNVVGGYFARVTLDLHGTEEIVRIPLDHIRLLQK